jgi:hypothetical protein
MRQVTWNARPSSWYSVRRVRPAQVVVVAVVIEVGVDDVEASFSPKFGGKFAGGALQTHNTTRPDQPSALIFNPHYADLGNVETRGLTSSHPKHPHCSPRPSLQPTTPPSV